MLINKENLSTKRITEFTTDDTIYIRDMKGFNKPPVYCSFIKYESGRVYGTVQVIDEKNKHSHTAYVGEELSATLDNCSLYGATTEDPESPRFIWFRPDGYAYTKSDEMKKPLESRVSHESFGTMTVMRHQSSHHTSLFGSSIRHLNTIAITIHEADVLRSLNSDYIHAGKEILQVEMSPTQFAEMITSGGQGGGTPVTISRRAGRSMEQCPFESKREVFRNEFKAKMENLSTETESIAESVETVLEKKSLNNADKEFILSQIKTLTQNVQRNIPFVAEQFDRQLDKATTEAKGEIEAFFESKIHSLGLEAFSDEVKKYLQAPSLDVPQLEE